MSRPPAPKDFSQNPLAWLAASFAAGIPAGSVSAIGAMPLAATAAALAIAACFLRQKVTATVLIMCAFAVCGAASYSFELSDVSPDRLRTIYDGEIVGSGTPVEVEAVLVSEPEAAPGGYFLTARSEGLTVRGTTNKASGNVRIFVAGDHAEQGLPLKYGSRIIAACPLEREEEFRNPGVLPKREALDRMGIDAVCVVKDPALIEHIADESVFIPLAWVYRQRSRVIEIFRDRLDPRTAGVMIASLLGNRHFLDKETADLFREGGTFHILVISGLHITFIGGLLLLSVKLFTRDRRVQFAVTATVLWAYTLAVGAEIPVVRAAVMFTVVHLAYVMHRRSQLLNSLGLCALAFLAWRPSDLFGPSFLLTFCSVASILAISLPLTTKLHDIGKWTPTPATPLPPKVPTAIKPLGGDALLE